MSKRRLLIMLPVCAIFALWAVQAGGYPNYQDPAGGINNNCAQCHPGFIGGFAGPLHGVHLGFITDCSLCHIVTGDNPPTANCAGCHVQGGLVLHHTNAGAPSDAFGLFCATCHPGATSPGEDVLPPNYGGAGTSLTDPCADALDNDGDLAYDGDDDDCVTIPVESTTWGAIKAIY